MPYPPQRRPSEHRTYRDRREAGRVLAELLSAYRGGVDLVLGLPRGGVPVAWEVAAALRARLDVFVVRKLGVPQHPELALGAVSSGGSMVLNDAVVRSLGVTNVQLDEVLAREVAELKRRERTYRGGRAPLDVQGQTVVVVDDGAATGASMRSALHALRFAGPAEVIAAVPVGPPCVYDELGSSADHVLCASTPAHFEAVGQAYADFHQVTDEEVQELLRPMTARWET